MADEFTWKLSEIRTRFRSHIGKSTTSEISDAECNKRINDYYQNHFPNAVKVDDYRTFFTQATSATDDGNYDIEQTEIALEKPVFCDNDEIELLQNPEEFFQRYPENEQYLTAPTLAIGSSDTTKVKNSAFTYKIAGYAYSKASAETAFSGLSTVPQNKYGAFSLKIDDDGDITIAEADDNSTGYDTPKKAIEDLADAAADSCYMGFVTVMSTDSGGFIPGTTALDDSAVTDTYTDGQPANRGTPECVCVYTRKLYVKPRADDIYLIKARDLIRPAVFSADTSVPANKKWGPIIAAGAAIFYLIEEEKDIERAAEIAKAYELHDSSIRDDFIKQLRQRGIERNW